MKGSRTATLTNGAVVPKPLARLAAIQVTELARIHPETLDAAVALARGENPALTPEQLELLKRRGILDEFGGLAACWGDLLLCSVQYAATGKELDAGVEAEDAEKAEAGEGGKIGEGGKLQRVRILTNPIQMGLKQLNRLD